jgi:hypothetical protein
MANNRATAMRFLLGKGLTRQQAAGVVGSLMQESGLRPTAKNPSSGALGIGQWLGGRKTNLLNSGNSGLRGQLDFLWSELQGPENAALKRLKGAHSVADAVDAFTWGFERPGRAEANIPNRVKQARAALGTGGGGGGSTPVMPNPDNRRLTSDAGAQAQTAQITLPERPRLQITAPTAPAFAARASTSQAPTSQPGAPQTAAYNAPARFEAGRALEALTALGQVAAWIKPILSYGRAHGWKGSVNSGYRTFADQTRIYNSGVRPAARPGTSNHEGTAFPRGAIDVSDPQSLSKILRRSKYANALVYAGPKDPVHFSHPHGGSY